MDGYVKWYDGLDFIIKLIFAIIPITSWINAVVYRIAKGHIISGIIAIFLGFIFWIIDLISVIVNGKPQWLLF